MASGQFLRNRGTQPIGRVALLTAPIAAVAEQHPRVTRPFQPEKPRPHYRFDPEISRRDALVRVREAIAERRQLMAGQRGRAVRLRLVLELDGLREAEAALLGFEAGALEIAAKVESANVLQDISLLDAASPTYREDLFRLRQRLGSIAAGDVADDRAVSTACMAIRVLEESIRRLGATHSEQAPVATVLDDHASLLDEQRMHALVGLLQSLGRARLAGMSRDRTEAVIQTFRRVDPQAFGFDPRNQRFVRHMADLIDRVTELGKAS